MIRPLNCIAFVPVKATTSAWRLGARLTSRRLTTYSLADVD